VGFREGAPRDEARGCHPILQPILSELPRDGEYILMSERGDRYRETSLTNMICSASAEPGFPGYSPHGLRHLAGSALAEAGCSTPEIMFVLGHLTEKEAATYVKQARRTVMARSAMDEWAGNVKVLSTPPKKL
jgi:integrase